MTKVLPILFNTEMVKAILDNRKTATRRLIKAPYYVDFNGYMYTIMHTAPKSSPIYKVIGDMPIPDDFTYCRFDILYVRETWRVGAWDIRNQMIAFDYKDGTCGELVYISDRDMFERLVNQSREDARKSKCEYNGADFFWKKGESPCRWRPSIHMPKEAARIWLKVRDVRAELLQDITDAGAESEGAEYTESLTARENFKRIWNSTIPKSDLAKYGWDANHWVAAIEFERCEKPENF